MEGMNGRGIRWTDKNRRGRNAKGNEKEEENERGGSDVLANPNTGNGKKGETENKLRSPGSLADTASHYPRVNWRDILFYSAEVEGQNSNIDLLVPTTPSVLKEYSTDLALHTCNIVLLYSCLILTLIVQQNRDIVFFYSAHYSYLPKPGAYITHNAIQPQQLRVWLFYIQRWGLFNNIVFHSNTSCNMLHN